MKLNRRLSVLSLVAVAATVSAVGFSADYTVDASHSHVGFTVRHMFSKVSGEFKDFEGKFSFDDKKPEASKVEFTAKTASINTNNEKRDGHLKSADFFDAEKNPTLSFKSNKVQGSGKKFKLSGDLTMHGVTKPVTFDVEFLGQDKDPWGGTRAGFTAHAKIKRKDFGLNWNKTLESGGLLVGEDVEINIETEATVDQAAAAK